MNIDKAGGAGGSPHTVVVHGTLLGEYETVAVVTVEHDVHVSFGAGGQVDERWDYADMLLARVWDPKKVIAKRRFTRADVKTFLDALQPVLDKRERAHLTIEGFEVDVGPHALRALGHSFSQWVA